MDAKLRIIRQLPPAELQRQDGFATAQRGRSLTCEDVRRLLKSGPVQFVVADVGVVPRWIPQGECFKFWKSEVQPHLASAGIARLDQFLGGYCYFAVQWETRTEEQPIVVLEKQH